MQGKTVGLNCIYFIAIGLTGKMDELRAWIGTCDWDVDWDVVAIQLPKCSPILLRNSRKKPSIQLSIFATVPK